MMREETREESGPSHQIPPPMKVSSMAAGFFQQLFLDWISDSLDHLQTAASEQFITNPRILDPIHGVIDVKS